MQPGERSRKQSKETKDAISNAKHKSQNDADKSSFSDAEFFSDPHGVLAKLATKHKKKQIRNKKGIAFRDPFDPAFRRELEREKRVEEKLKAVRKKSNAKHTNWSAIVKRTSKKKSKTTEEPRNETSPKIRAKELAKALRKKFGGAGGQQLKARRPVVKVDVTKDGVVLSLTDQVGYSMFDSGLAVPRPATVALADTLAAAIKAHHKGQIVISGHTDARAFSGAKYNNWRFVD